MNIKVLILGAAVAAVSTTTFAGSGAALLRGPASTPSVAETTVTTIGYAPSTAAISPRAHANSARLIAGTSADSTVGFACRQNMTASPRAVAECGSYSTMPLCMKSAMK